MKIVYVGPLREGATCKMRMRALQDLGHEILPVDTWPSLADRKIARLFQRILSKLGYPRDSANANIRIRELALAERFDILWIDKGLTIKPSTLMFVRGNSKHAAIVSYSPDDMARPHNQSRSYLASLPLYDVHFTTKTYNVKELGELGAKRVVFVGNAYDPHTHRPMPWSEKDRRLLGGPVGFVGAFESARALDMLSLAEAGIPVRIWGENWDRSVWRHPNLKIEGRAIWSDSYARAISHFDVNLCFLRRINRDRQTTRSIEIPACGGFMLAERTQEHLELFAEGKEAEYFESREELLEKVRFYLAHVDERRKIALAGQERCIRSGYDYYSRMRWMLERVRST